MAKKKAAKKPTTKKKAIKAKKTKTVKKALFVKEGEITFDYIKSNFFRVIRVDGAHGGIVPQANAIQMALYNERQPIPKKEMYRLKKDHSLGDVVLSEKREAIIREVEVELLLDITTAKRIHEWLGKKIKIIEDINTSQEKS